MKTTARQTKTGMKVRRSGGLGLGLGLAPNRIAQVRRASQQGRLDAFLEANPTLNARIQNRATGARGQVPRYATNAQAVLAGEDLGGGGRVPTARRQGLDALFPATTTAADARDLYRAAMRGRLQGGDQGEGNAGLTIRTARPGRQQVTTWRGGPVDVQDPAVQALLAQSQQRASFGLGLGFDPRQRAQIRTAAAGPQGPDYGTLGTLLAPALDRVGRNSWRAQSLMAQLGVDPSWLQTLGLRR